MGKGELLVTGGADNMIALIDVRHLVQKHRLMDLSALYALANNTVSHMPGKIRDNDIQVAVNHHRRALRQSSETRGRLPLAPQHRSRNRI